MNRFSLGPSKEHLFSEDDFHLPFFRTHTSGLKDLGFNLLYQQQIPLLPDVINFGFTKIF